MGKHKNKETKVPSVQRALITHYPVIAFQQILSSVSYFENRPYHRRLFTTISERSVDEIPYIDSREYAPGISENYMNKPRLSRFLFFSGNLNDFGRGLRYMVPSNALL